MDFMNLWFILFVCQLLMMAWDNLFWIFKLPIPKVINDFILKVTGANAYTGTYTFKQFKEMPFKEKIRFVVFERFIQVLINPLDILACLSGSFVFTIILIGVI